jgi:hypothetical protein
MTACHQLAVGALCAPGSCSAGVMQTAGACQADESCQQTTSSCAPYGCSGDQCATTCSDAGDCFSSDYFCTNSAPHTCEGYARIAGADYPTTLHVGQPVTFMAHLQTSVAARYRWWFSSPQDGGTTKYLCWPDQPYVRYPTNDPSYPSDYYCEYFSWAPQWAGQYTITLEAGNLVSPSTYDDTTSFTITVEN